MNTCIFTNTNTCSLCSIIHLERDRHRLIHFLRISISNSHKIGTIPNGRGFTEQFHLRDFLLLVVVASVYLSCDGRRREQILLRRRHSEFVLMLMLMLMVQMSNRHMIIVSEWRPCIDRHACVGPGVHIHVRVHTGIFQVHTGIFRMCFFLCLFVIIAGLGIRFRWLLRLRRFGCIAS